MATAQAAILPLCDLCESKDSRWFCDDCQINLCEKCKTIHQRGPKTKNDDIIPISQVQQRAQGKVVPVLCDIHKTKLCELYCRECKELICAQCLSGSHSAHGFVSVESLIDGKTAELNNIEQKVKSKLVSYETALGSESKEHSDYMSHIDHLKDEVKGQTDKLVKNFYKLKDKQLFELSSLQKDEENRYMSVCNDFQCGINGMKKTLATLQKARVSGNAATMIQVVKESTELYQSLEGPTMSALPRPEFKRDDEPEEHLFVQLQGQVNVHPAKVVSMPEKRTHVIPPKCVIDMNNVKVKFRVNIKGKTGRVNALIPTEHNMAWIAIRPDKRLSLITVNGNVIKTSAELDDEIYDAVSYDKDILVVYEKSHCVMRLRQDGDSVTKFSDLSPFYTSHLCVTSQQDVIVSLLTSPYFDRKIRSKVVKLDRRGQIIQEIQYRNKEPLFTWADTVTSLPTGDVLVKNYESLDVLRLICCDERGNYKYTWNGEVGGQKVKNFWPSRLTHDGKNVYITDSKNHCVYTLDMYGKAEQFSVYKQGITNPYVISIDSRGRMWIGCKSYIYVLE